MAIYFRTLPFSFSRHDVLLEALSFNYREPPFFAFDPRIFSSSRCSLLNSISPFFSFPLSSIPAGNGWETGAAVFVGDDDVVVVVVVRRRRSLSFIEERRSSPRAEDCNFEAKALFTWLFPVFCSFSLSLSSLTSSPASYHVYRTSRF